jgi:FkbM family methyltransferase
MISYALNAEDVRLNRVFPKSHVGFYIDVGAWDPVFLSTTKHFYDRGWIGINIEPSSEAFRSLTAQRTRDINLNLLLSASEGMATLYEAPAGHAYSTATRSLLPQLRERFEIDFREIQIETTTLARVCEDYVTTEIDFLSIDVEGHEKEVIAGGNWARWRPRVLVIEAIEPGSGKPTHEAWEPILLAADYLLAVFDGVNRFYVRAEDSRLAELLAEPVGPYECTRFGGHATEESLAAARVINWNMWQEIQTMRIECHQLQNEYQRLARAVRNQAVLEGRQPPPIGQAPDAMARSALSVAPDVWPTALALARRVSAFAARYPRTWAATKRVARPLVRRFRANRNVG